MYKCELTHNGLYRGKYAQVNLQWQLTKVNFIRTESV